jgi:hypothetical protein
VTCGILVDAIKMSVKPEYGNASSLITNTTGEQLVNIYLNLNKELNFKIMVTYKNQQQTKFLFLKSDVYLLFDFEITNILRFFGILFFFEIGYIHNVQSGQWQKDKTY